MGRTARVVGVGVLALVVLAVGGLAWWLQPQELLPEATESLASTETVTFRDASAWLEWSPAEGGATTGLVVYPGAKVPAEAYGPLAQAIADEGYLVAVVPMPLNLAILGVSKADGPIDAHPEIRGWAIGGHSLGGSMAAQYVAEHPDDVDGLAFWAAYAATDLSDLDLPVLSTWGSLDAGAERMSGAEARAFVPADAVFVEIPGGNHEQMGWYTGQPNDPPATISREDQQARVAELTVALLEQVQAAAPPAPNPSPSPVSPSPSPDEASPTPSAGSQSPAPSP